MRRHLDSSPCRHRAHACGWLRLSWRARLAVWAIGGLTRLALKHRGRPRAAAGR